MINNDFSKKIFKNISSLNLSPEVGDKYYFKDTIKERLLDEGEDFNYNFFENNTFEVEIKCDVYKKSLFSDYYFGRKRIIEQVKSLESLIKNDKQVAWVLVTAYYSVFYMSNEVTKLLGKYIVNFSLSDMSKLYTRTDQVVPDVFLNKTQPNYCYQVNVTNSSYENYVKLVFSPKSPKPHLEVWRNLSEVIRELKVADSLMQHKTLFLNICDSSNERWDTPSKIRNDWNYRFADYYDTKGSSLGCVFYKNIKNKKSAMSWGSKRSLRPDEKNNVASISYVYHCLYEIIKSIDTRLCIS